jgi:hypothetical protein
MQPVPSLLQREAHIAGLGLLLRRGVLYGKAANHGLPFHAISWVLFLAHSTPYTCIARPRLLASGKKFFAFFFPEVEEDLI